ncbi:MAG TPA: VWA domain-containing protein, partial [Phytomonospora sp.]
TNTLATWTALNRTTNLLFVMDTSEAMNAATTVDGKNTTLMEVAKEAVEIALNMIGDQSRVGLWQFSDDQGSGVPYQPVVGLEPLKGNRDAISGGIDAMLAGGTSGLYDTALAAYDNVTQNYLAEATNMVVILTAGANDNPNGGLSLEDLTAQLTGKRDPNKPVSLMTIGYGEGADETAMQQISAATKGQYFASTWPGEISKTLLNALFNAQ